MSTGERISNIDKNSDRSIGEHSPAVSFAVAAAHEAWAPQAIPSQVRGNPVFPGADPDITIADNKYCIYPTTDANSNNAFYVHESPDLKTWETKGPVLKLADIPWIKADGASHHELWAPGIFQENGKFYLYYAVGPQNPTPSRIGVAVCDTPDGKFKDIGKPLITGGNGWESIDPMVFKDPKTGDHYLYCGGSAGSQLHVYKLNPDLVSVDKEVEVATPKNFTEGAYMSYRNGLYYMSYSHGQWNTSNYQVCYSTSDSPTGSWNYKGPILQSNSEHIGPGHHAFLENPQTGQWYIVYHRWNDAGTTGKMPPSRSVAIDNLEFDKNGNILPIKMTDTGVAPSPLK